MSTTPATTTPSFPQPVAAQTATGTAQPGTTPEALETLQVEADYEAYLQNRMGRCGY